MQDAQTTAASTTRLHVRVVDRFRIVQDWGHGGGGVVIREVEIAAACPRCGGPRGAPILSRFCEDGEHYWVDTWTNPCGHLDRYAAVLDEAGLYTGEEVVTNGYAGDWRGRKQGGI